MKLLIIAALTIYAVSCSEPVVSSDSKNTGSSFFRDPSSIDPAAIVAEVDGVPILKEDILSLMNKAEGNIDVGEALDALVRQELLVKEAERRGLGQNQVIELERDKALARALTQKTGESVQTGHIPKEALSSAYEALKSRFQRGPGRKVAHVVARTGKSKRTGKVIMTPEEAEAAIAELISQLPEKTTAKQLKDAAASLKEEKGYKLKYESLPPFTKDSKQFVQEFVAAVFDMKEAGDVSSPIETKYGWHVILLVEKQPPVNIPKDEAQQILAQERLPTLRKERTEAFVESLIEKYGVFIYEDAIRRDVHP